MTLDVARIRALCFDVDGTLRDTDDQYVERLRGYLKFARFLLPGRDPRLAARRLIMALEDPGNLVFYLADVLGIDNLFSRSHQPVVKIRTRKTSSPLIVPGVAGMLEALRQSYPLALITTRGQTSTFDFLESSHLRDYFSVIVTGRTCARTKPHPMPVLWAAAQLGVPPEACLMVGDTSVDIRAGRSAGAQTAGVLCGFGLEGELRRAGADLILKSTSELAGYLL
jgi:N-acetyl-D-muramate 6-phosphate phosphatase